MGSASMSWPSWGGFPSWPMRISFSTKIMHVGDVLFDVGTGDCRLGRSLVYAMFL